MNNRRPLTMDGPAAGLGYRVVRRQSLRSTLVGCLIVAGGAVLAAVTGEARGFFLVPAVIPFAVILTCLATMTARRPLTGLILNRVTGGPPDWYRNPTGPIFATLVTVTVVAVRKALKAQR